VSFDPGNRLITAVDVPDRSAADALVERLGGASSWVKVGLELFIAEGPGLVRDYVDRGLKVMLDLKLHDIPNTVAKATASAAGLGAGLLTIHTGGGAAMMRAAVEQVKDRGEGRTRILAVTVLTSMDQSDIDAVGMSGSPADLVLKRARLAIEAGCDGVVSSPHEAARLREIAPEGFLIVTPGVRPAGAAVGDQKRVMTPRMAREAGADLVVVGRPIRNADDPAAAARAIADELA
jgi:orotidine-5'-phosphate decarboxylase